MQNIYNRVGHASARECRLSNTHNNIDVQHKVYCTQKKRQLSGALRKKAQEQLGSEMVYVYKTKKAGELMKYGEMEQTDLHETINYRDARKEAINNYIGLHGPNDVLESIQYYSSIPDSGIKHPKMWI